MTITIPQPENKQWKQANNSDVFGNLSETKQISFDLEGYLKLSHSSRATMNETVDSDFDRVAVIIYNGDVSKFFIQTYDDPFEIDRRILSQTPSQITASNFPAGSSRADAAWFDAKLAVSEASDLKYYDASSNAWVDTNVSLSSTATGQHPVKNFLSKSCLAVCNLNTVLLYSALSATPTLLATLTIPADFEITSAAYHNQQLCIGTRHKYGGKAAMYVWNGEGTAAQSVYEVDANIIFDLCVYDQSIAAFASNGALYRFAGSGFVLLDAFPIYYTSRVLNDENNINMYHNVLKANGDVLYIAFSDSDNAKTRMMNQPSGIWCYDPRVGLHHKYSFSNALTYKLNDPAISTSTDQITVTQVLATGTEVWYTSDGGTANAALKLDTKYFVIFVDSTHIKLATTKANALAGTAIDFTADDGTFERWVFFPNVDYGLIWSEKPSALQTIDYSQQYPEYGLDVIWAADVYKRDGVTTESHLGSVSTGVESRGFFVTSKIPSSNLTDNFNLISLKFGRFLSELDKIIIKYRLIDDERNEINVYNTDFWKITWTSATTFTTNAGNVTDWAQMQVGDEINVCRGAAGGLMAHVTEISAPSANVYTVTIDESYSDYVSGDISTAVFRNWKKWQTISYTGTQGVDDQKGIFSKQLGVNGKYIQFKVELRGIGVKIEEFSVDNVYKLSLKKSSL